MDETKRANRLWRHAIGSTGADELLLRGGRRAVRHRRRQDARRALSAPRQREQGLDRVAASPMPTSAPTGRSRCARCSRAAPTSSTTSSTAPAASTSASTTPGATSASSRSTPKRPTWPNAEELIAARDRVMLDDVDVFAGHLAVTERVAGSLQLRIIDLASGDDHAIAFDEPAYSVHTSGNAEFETATLRFVYTSLTTPASTYDYDLATRERVLRKRQPVPGYDPSLYASERIFAVAGRRHRGADLARLPQGRQARRRRSRSSSTATAATASRSTPRSRSRASRCSTAASSSRSPTSAAAATSAAAGTRPARWRGSRPPSTTSSPAPRS